MARIYRHGSFLFFVYVCVTSLLCMLGFGNIGIAGFWKRLFTVSFEVLVGAGVTIFFIDRLNAHRERESLKRRLIREAGSRSQDIAISAVEWMDREGWLRGEEGLLKGANLREARLQDARLNGANLQGANLQLADLRGAGLEDANLQGANLVSAKAKGSVLKGARLDNAMMNSADLNGAYLECAQLENATLSNAKMRSANLDNASFRCARMLNVDMTDSVTSRTNFFRANLHKAKLQNLTDLNSNHFERATLTCVDLARADLEDCNLKGADLRLADLRDSNLIGANLHGANLHGALLEGAQILLGDHLARLHNGNGETGSSTEYNEFWQRGTQMSDAVLPDGTIFSDDMDYDAIAKFTDREHPDFARSLANVESIRDANFDSIDWEMTFSELYDKMFTSAGV